VSSSERIAANSDTKKRYESEISIAIHAKGRSATNTDVMPTVAAMNEMVRRTRSFLVSALMVDPRYCDVDRAESASLYPKLTSDYEIKLSFSTHAEIHAKV
jgi:hypothetical protein